MPSANQKLTSSRLTERTRMPCSPRARLESSTGTLDKRRTGCMGKRSIHRCLVPARAH